jgi:hypothetical protein
MNIPNRWAKLSDLARHLAYRQEWMPLAEAAAFYRVTPETMVAWVRQRRFTAREIESSLWVSRNELELGLRRRPSSATLPHYVTHTNNHHTIVIRE